MHPTHFPTDLYLDASLTPRQRVAVAEGVKAWEKATDDIVKINVLLGNPDPQPPNSYLVISFNSDDPTAATLDEDHNLLGYTGFFLNPRTLRYVGGIFFVSDRLRQSLLPERIDRWVALHELGHFVGLRHRDQDDDSIMVPYFHTYLSPCITKLDLKDFCGVYNCDGRKTQEVCVEVPNGQ